MNIFELHGRLVEEHQRVVEAYEQAGTSMVALLRGLQSGDVALGSIEVTDDGWQVRPTLISEVPHGDD